MVESLETPEYNVANDAAVVILYGSADQAIIGGLNSLTLPEFTSTTIEAQEFRKITRKFAGLRSFGDVAFAGNLAISNAGQRYLAQRWKDQAKLTDVRFYLDLVNFMTCDLATDPASGFQVMKSTPGAGANGAIFPYDGGMTVNGEVAYFYKHYVDVATPVMAFAGSTITGVPEATLVAAGDTLIVEGATTAANDGQYIVESVVTTTVTVTVAFDTDEPAILATTIHAGTI